jgi:signal peptidase I
MWIFKWIITFVMEVMETVVFVGSLFIVVYLFIAQPNQVQGASMEPTFQNGNYIFTSKVTYRFRSPQRGDVIVFHSPRNPDIEYIKRIIGLPGDSIMLSNREMYVNGIKLSESYISDATYPIPEGYLKENEAISVPIDQLFVMGDNRPRSSDSRDFGPIKFTSVIGQVFFRYFPADEVGFIPNPFPPNLRNEETLLPQRRIALLENHQLFRLHRL